MLSVCEHCMGVCRAMDLIGDTKQAKGEGKSGLVETKLAAMAVCMFIKPGAYEEPWLEGVFDYCNYPMAFTPYMIHVNEFWGYYYDYYGFSRACDDSCMAAGFLDVNILLPCKVCLQSTKFDREWDQLYIP